MKRKATLVVLVIALFVGFSAAGQPVTNADNGNVTHMTNPPATNATSDASAKTNAVAEERYFKKVIDAESGLCAIVGLDKNTITLKDKNGRVIWTLNLTNAEPMMPSGGIYDLSFFGQFEGKPHGLFGRDSLGWGNGAYMTFYIELDTGKVTGGGVQHNP